MSSYSERRAAGQCVTCGRDAEGKARCGRCVAKLAQRRPSRKYINDGAVPMSKPKQPNPMKPMTGYRDAIALCAVLALKSGDVIASDQWSEPRVIIAIEPWNGIVKTAKASNRNRTRNVLERFPEDVRKVANG